MRLVHQSGQFTTLQPGDGIIWEQDGRMVKFLRDGTFMYFLSDDEPFFDRIKERSDFDLAIERIAVNNRLIAEFDPSYPNPTFIFR